MKRSHLRRAAFSRQCAALLVLAASQAQAQRSWIDVTRPLGALLKKPSVITLIAAAPGSDQVIVGIDMAGLFATTDGGLSWSPLGAPGQIAQLPVQVVFDPKRPRTFWVSGMHGPGVFKTMDGGASFVRLGDFSNCEGIGVDLSDEYRRTLVVAMHETVGIQRSISSGMTWKDIAGSLPRGSNFPTLPVVFDSQTYIVATAGYGAPTSGIYRTSNGGATWIRVHSSGTRNPGLVASDGAVYLGPDAAVYLPDKQGGQLIRSDDKGLTWRVLAGPAFVTPVELPDGVLVSAAGRQMYRSKDRGESWRPFGPPAPANIRALAYNSGRKQIFAVVWEPAPPVNAGVWKIGAEP